LIRAEDLARGIRYALRTFYRPPPLDALTIVATVAPGLGLPACDAMPARVSSSCVIRGSWGRSIRGDPRPVRV
jgi:hypothetical protein